MGDGGCCSEWDEDVCEEEEDPEDGTSTIHATARIMSNSASRRGSTSAIGFGCESDEDE